MNESWIGIDATQISAEVYHQTSAGVYYVKVSIPSLGMYINSFKVMPSPNYPEKGPWVQWPSFWVRPKWIKPIEFQCGSEFKMLIEDAVKRAVDVYTRERLVPQEEFSEEDFKRQLGEAIDRLDINSPP